MRRNTVITTSERVYGTVDGKSGAGQRTVLSEDGRALQEEQEQRS